MQRVMRWIGMGSMALASATTAYAGPVDVPNTFQGGARALASEVNGNFDAVESAIDDNAARVEVLEAGLEAANTAIEGNSTAADDNTAAIANNAGNIAALQAMVPGAGVQVRVADVVVGRYLSHGSEPIEVDVSGSGGAETEAVARRTVIQTADVITVVSPAGYFFNLSTTDLSTLPFGTEGTLAPLPLIYESADCTGQAYLAVEGPVGLFSTFEPGVGDNLPAKRWTFRQGVAFRSPDPTAVDAAYMVRRGQMAQQVAINSVYVWSTFSGSAVCIDAAVIPGHTGNEVNSVFPVEPLDPVETGIAADMAGDITIGL